MCIGINTHLVDNSILEKMKNAGIKYFRIDIDWIECQPARDAYNWNRVDRVVKYCKENGIQVIPSIAYTPEWAGKGRNHPPDNVEDWENFVKAVITRYNFPYISFWNEPNLDQFYAESVEDFAEKIFLPAARTARELDPAIKILGFELAHMTGPGHMWKGSHWHTWLKYLLQKCGTYIDIFTHHIYDEKGKNGPGYIYRAFEEKAMFGLIPGIQEVLKTAFSENCPPVWLTETGWTTSEVSEEKQAEYYRELLKIRQQKGYPQKIIFYSAIDDPKPEVKPFGILRRDHSEKPAYWEIHPSNHKKSSPR